MTLPELPFKSDAFREALEGYIEMRVLNKKKMTTRAVELMFKKFQGFTEAECIEALDRSTENSWTGVFPKKKTRNGFV